MEKILVSTENSKTNEPRKSALNLSQRLDLRGLNKHVALKNLSINYTWKNIKKQHKSKKLKTISNME